MGLITGTTECLMHVDVYSSSWTGVDAVDVVSVDAEALSLAELAFAVVEDELEDGLTGLGALGARLFIKRRTCCLVSSFARLPS